MTERKWTPPEYASQEYRQGYYKALTDSASSDLYEALEDLMEDACLDWAGEPVDLTKGRSALAKARGEQ